LTAAAAAHAADHAALKKRASELELDLMRDQGGVRAKVADLEGMLEVARQEAAQVG